MITLPIQTASDLPWIGEGLQTQLIELWRDPTIERCETVAVNLAGARMVVLRLRETLLLEERPAGASR